MEGIFNWIMAGYIFEIFQSILFDKTTTCSGYFCHSESADTLPIHEIRVKCIDVGAIKVFRAEKKPVI